MKLSKFYVPLVFIPGFRFDTQFERGCIILSTPDEHNDFIGYDCENAICQYNVRMVKRVHTSPLMAARDLLVKMNHSITAGFEVESAIAIVNDRIKRGEK